MKPEEIDKHARRLIKTCTITGMEAYHLWLIGERIAELACVEQHNLSLFPNLKPQYDKAGNDNQS